jgi:hypothetical protein
MVNLVGAVLLFSAILIAAVLPFSIVNSDATPSFVSSSLESQISSSLTISIVGKGSVNLNNTGGNYQFGDIVLLSAVPQNGWAFTRWSGNLSGSANPAAINVTGMMGVTATFEQTTTPTSTGGSSFPIVGDYIIIGVLVAIVAAITFILFNRKRTLIKLE